MSFFRKVASAFVVMDNPQPGGAQPEPGGHCCGEETPYLDTSHRASKSSLMGVASRVVDRRGSPKMSCTVAR